MTFSEFIQAAIAFFQGTLTGAEKTLLICCIGLAIEHFRPTDKDQPASSILFNLIWLLNFLVVSNFIMIYAGKVIGPTVAALGGPLFKLNLPEVWWTPIVHVSIFLLMYDFGYYCFHRCQHTWRWFWCHHKLHHTDEHMNATTSFRHHWLENVYRIPFIFVPMAWLVEIHSTTPVVLFDLGLAWAVFTHLNLRLHMGPLTNVFAGPQYHRIHHSNQRQHQDRNFAAFFPIWDILLGTHHKPLKDEFPPCGTLNGEQTDSVKQAHIGVFVDWYRMAREALKTKQISQKAE